MDRTTFITEMDRHLKLVRTEYGCTQEVMARMLGISKKTLVEIEKGRSSLGWTGAVAFSTLFADSQILNGLFGGEAADMVRALALAEQGKKPVLYGVFTNKTMGGKIWWRVIQERPHCRIQQNVISQHYRALDDQDRRICYSFDLEEIELCLREWESQYEAEGVKKP